MHRGYVKNWRKSIDHPLFKKPLIWHFWNYCLIKASHKDAEFLINGVFVSIKPGQFIFGRKIAATETGLTEQQIRTCLKHLKNLKNLTIQPTNRYSIISITKWDIYQSDNSLPNQPINQQSTSNQPAINHIQEQQEHKEVKNTVGLNGNFKDTALKIYENYISEIDPKLKTKKRAVKNIETWLKRGRVESDLISAYKNYKKSMSKDRQYRKNPANFYGINEDFAFDFLPVNIEPDKSQKIETQEDIDKELAEALS